jgi:hypothetical protein
VNQSNREEETAMNYREILVQFLNRERQGSLTIKKMPGSSDSSVFLVGGKEIYRVGSKYDIDSLMNVYTRFLESLSCYDRIFPWVELLIDGDVSIMRMEYIGKRTLENMVLQMGKTQEGVSEFFLFNRNVLEQLRIIYSETHLSQTSSENFFQNRLFSKELINALSINLEKAGLSKEGRLFLEKLELSLNKFNYQSISSLTHKDFSLGNILISDKNGAVKFIDPRISIPYTTESSAIGNIAVDILGYLVSIERKEMELQREYPLASLKSIKEEIEREIARYLNEGVFSYAVSEACKAFWYSVYAACKCEYCTSQERIWLYDNMVQQLKTFLIE